MICEENVLLMWVLMMGVGGFFISLACAWWIIKYKKSEVGEQ